MNEYDSNRIAGLAKEAGYLKTDNFNDIDCYILNTCHIREKATEKVYHDIGRLKKNYKNRKKPIVLVAGCVAQAENSEMLEREPYIDAVIGPQSYQGLPKILLEFEKRKEKLNFTNFDVIEKFDKLNAVLNSDSKIETFQRLLVFQVTSGTEVFQRIPIPRKFFKDENVSEFIKVIAESYRYYKYSFDSNIHNPGFT